MCTGNENSKPIWNKFIIRKDIIETSQVVLNFCRTVYIYIICLMSVYVCMNCYTRKGFICNKDYITLVTNKNKHVIFLILVVTSGRNMFIFYLVYTGPCTDVYYIPIHYNPPLFWYKQHTFYYWIHKVSSLTNIYCQFWGVDQCMK